MGKGGVLSHAHPRLARHDGHVLSEHGMAVPRTSCIRALVRIQSAAWHSDIRTSGVAGDACFGNGGTMTSEFVDKIVNSVLYEGYMLYPYRRSSLKNQHRWNFGLVYPDGLEP